MSNIRLVIADVDGTLVTGEKMLTEAAVAAVRDLRDAGIEFAITSGRPPRGMQMLIEPLDLRTPIAGFNGGAFVNRDLSVIETHILSAEAAAAALGVILGHDLDAWLYTAEEWLVRDVNAPHVAREARTVGYEPSVVASFDPALLARTVKIVGVSDDHAVVEAAEEAAQRDLGARAAASRSQPYYLDVTHAQANKGAVVDRLSAMLDISREEIVTIGDGPNDVLMFRRSGMSIAMGNASDAVKSQATAVTGSNEDDGFAAAMRRFVLAEADGLPAGAAARTGT